MNVTQTLNRASTPIVEAVVDIDCDLDPRFDLARAEASSKAAFRDRYPRFRRRLGREQGAIPPLEALQFLQEDDRQLVQVRAEGFSFNRLQPYSSLDEYLPEIERAWQSFVSIAMPVVVQRVRLRYLNRIVLPADEGRVDLDQYLTIGPRLPDEDRLTFLSFVHQHTAFEPATGKRVDIVLMSEPSTEANVPITLDIVVFDTAILSDPKDWSTLLKRIQSLRELKNRVFRNTLTEQCRRLLQLPS